MYLTHHFTKNIHSRKKRQGSVFWATFHFILFFMFLFGISNAKHCIRLKQNNFKNPQFFHINILGRDYTRNSTWKILGLKGTWPTPGTKGKVGGGVSRPQRQWELWVCLPDCSSAVVFFIFCKPTSSRSSLAWLQWPCTYSFTIRIVLSRTQIPEKVFDFLAQSTSLCLEGAQ